MSGKEGEKMGKVLIIAEAGVNNNASLELSYKMVDVAREAGADIVKFQTCKPENLVSIYAEKAEYQKETSGAAENQLEMLRRVMLRYEDFYPLKEYCEKIGIRFLTTPFDIESVRFVDGLVDVWKIPSGEITNLPYLIEIAKTGKAVILSTGMSELEEVRDAINILKKYGAGEISLLHCNTQYPTPFEDVNLNAMDTLRKEFGLPVGYSDHTPGIEVPIAAVAMGATIIEKHFTLDKNMEGPDHKASLEPKELKKMVESIRHIEAAMGDGVKTASASEEPNKVIARKSIVAKANIKAGVVFTEENITTKRPGNGISPMQWFEVLGKTATRDFMEDELISL